MLASHWPVYFLRINGPETVGNKRSSSLCINTLLLRAAVVEIIVAESTIFSSYKDKYSNNIDNFLCVGLMFLR